MYQRNGKDTGSLVLDAGMWALNKMPGKIKGERIGEYLSNKYSNMQRKLVDADIRAGHKIHKTLEKHKATKPISNAFTLKHQVPLAEAAKGKPNELLEFSVPTLTAPIEKAKKLFFRWREQSMLTER